MTFHHFSSKHYSRHVTVQHLFSSKFFPTETFQGVDNVITETPNKIVSE